MGEKNLYRTHLHVSVMKGERVRDVADHAQHQELVREPDLRVRDGHLLHRRVRAHRIPYRRGRELRSEPSDALFPEGFSQAERLPSDVLPFGRGAGEEPAPARHRDGRRRRRRRRAGGADTIAKTGNAVACGDGGVRRLESTTTKQRPADETTAKTC